MLHVIRVTVQWEPLRRVLLQQTPFDGEVQCPPNDLYFVITSRTREAFRFQTAMKVLQLLPRDLVQLQVPEF